MNNEFNEFLLKSYFNKRNFNKNGKIKKKILNLFLLYFSEKNVDPDLAKKKIDFVKLTKKRKFIWSILSNTHLPYMHLIPKSFINNKYIEMLSELHEIHDILLFYEWIGYIYFILQNNIKSTNFNTINKFKFIKIDNIESSYKEFNHKVYHEMIYYYGFNSIIIYNNKINNNNLLIHFGWHDSKFYGLNFCNNNFNGAIIDITDRHSTFYQDYHDDIYKFLKKQFKKFINKTNKIFYGSSMGAYAALIYSSLFNNNICFALGPPIIDLDDIVIYKSTNSKNNFVMLNTDSNNLDKPIRVFNLKNNKYSNIRNHLITPKMLKNNSKRYILIGTSECNYHQNFNQTDAIYAGYLNNIDNTKIIVINTHGHAIGPYIDNGLLLKYMTENYSLLFSDQEKSIKNLLNNFNKFYKEDTKNICNSENQETCIINKKLRDESVEKDNISTYEIYKINKLNYDKLIIQDQEIKDKLIIFLYDDNVFRFLTNLKLFNGNILYIRNIINNDSDKINNLFEYIKNYISNNTFKLIYLIGCNVSANVCYQISSIINKENCICILFNPITFNQNNSSIYYENSVNVSTFPSFIKDLKKEEETQTKNIPKYIIGSISECYNLHPYDNKNRNYNSNQIYIGYILKLKNNKIILSRNSKSNIIEDVNMRKFINKLNKYQYEDFINLKKGGKILSKIIKINNE